MRVLFLNYEYPPLGGGAANATQYLLKEYEREGGLIVDLVTSAPDREQVIETLGEDIQIHKLDIGKNGNLHHQSKKDLLRYSYRAYRYADKLLQANEYDVIHAFFGVPCGVLAMRLGKKYKIPYIVSLRGADVPGYSERFSSLYNLLTPFIIRVWKNAHSVIANSQGLKELALKTIPDFTIPVIQNGVDTDEFQAKASESFEQNPFTILCVSRLTPRKGIRFLIESLTYMTEVPDAQLVIAGEGDEKEALVELTKTFGLEERVSFLGRISHEELSAIYQSAHVFCLPSQNEGMSNTLLEALASGLPLVATVTGGTEELVRESENGFYIEKSNPNDIAEKLTVLAKNRELCKYFGTKSRESSLKRNWNAVAKEYRLVYENMKNNTAL